MIKLIMTRNKTKLTKLNKEMNVVFEENDLVILNKKEYEEFVLNVRLLSGETELQSKLRKVLESDIEVVLSSKLDLPISHTLHDYKNNKYIAVDKMHIEKMIKRVKNRIDPVSFCLFKDSILLNKLAINKTHCI